ncbi:MAG: mucoidy inhibitor MuiA family protein [Deltaproteobacteria bacterium]|nr:mucoidy inhibitor MuiA family protein [Deltaproteobacteria bacterium]
MKRSVFPVSAVLFLLAVLCPAAWPSGLPSRVTKVVLYPEMAEVTRVVEVEASAGTVVLPGLTASLLPDSISAAVTAGEAGIAGIAVEDVFRAEPVDPRVKDLEKEIERLTDDKRRTEEAIKGNAREKELLERGVLSIYSGGEEPKSKGKESVPRLTPAEVDAALALFRSRGQEIGGKILDLERSARELDRKIAAARQEHDKIRPPRPMQEKAVRIDLARPGKCRLAVTYLVPAAGFAPRYNARMLPASGTLALELVGEAWQRTGEDWKEARLTFSTARPGRMTQLPPLPPWALDFYQPPVVRPMMMKMRESTGAAAAPAMEEGKAEEPPFAEKRFASFDVTLEGTHALAGTGEKKDFLLARREQKARMAWRSIPRAAEGAFITADGRNEGGLAVFAAPVSLFLEEAYVGKGRLADIPEGEEFRIDFGKDDAVQVKRKEIERKREEGGVFSKVKRVRFRYEIAAANFRKEAAPLTVLDRIPVPRHKDIVAKEVEITGGGKVGEAGEVKWEFVLAPGEKRTLELSFTVEYPADKEIHGL